MTKSELSEKKWRKFLHRVKFFKYVPFVEFVLTAGSLATGNLHENSDFDVILGVKKGRMFTSRISAVILFGLLGWRRKKLTHGEAASDKICMSHFVTSNGYKLKPPYNDYWQNLYQNLVPVLGDQEKINGFFEANDWLKPRRAYDMKAHKGNIFHLNEADSLIKTGLEDLFGGSFGDWLERVFKEVQIGRIEGSLTKNKGYKPRIIYSDDELEFHPDTKRIEEMLKNKKTS